MRCSASGAKNERKWADLLSDSKIRSSTPSGAENMAYLWLYGARARGAGGLLAKHNAGPQRLPERHRRSGGTVL